MQKRLLFFVIPVVVLLGLGGIGAYVENSRMGEETDGDLTELSLSQPEPATGDALPESLPAPEDVATEQTAEPEAAPADTAPQAATPDGQQAGPISTPAAAPVNVVVDGTDPKQPKTLGRADAPVTMHDYSSFTCPHCAHAHEAVLPLLIRDYVETGKLRIVFNDFPLNGEALEASKISRCMPGDKYYSFISLLFSTIDQWAPKAQQSLVQYAVLAGLPEDKAKACLADKDVETALVEGVQEASTVHKVSATPTFIFNDGEKVLQGARPYLEFQMAIDGLIEQAKDAAKKQ